MSQVVQYNEYGGPGVLTVVDRELPIPGPGQLLVRVRAAGINPLDLKLRRGEMAAMMPAEFPVVLGIDAADVVEGIGEGVDEIAMGDEVLGLAIGGSYREHAVLGLAFSKPASLPWNIAGSLPVVGLPALRRLDEVGVVAGETILIHGGGGSVGAIATQLAVQRGARVIASLGPPDDQRVQSYGALTVRYGPSLVKQVRAVASEGVDAAFDTSADGVPPESIKLAGGPDSVLTITDMDAAEHGVRFSMGAPPSNEDMSEMADGFASGRIELPIAGSYPLADASRDHADIDDHRRSGKFVLNP